jgi:hypothetical protein
MKTCFIIMPINTPDLYMQRYRNDKEHFLHVLNHLFIPSIKNAGLDSIKPISEGSEIIHGKIVKNLESADLVLCDISILNPNVFFELGIRVAINKPLCLVKDNLTENIPFDTSIINNYTYDSSLDTWLIENEVTRITKHIQNSINEKAGKNSLWEYFSLSMPASIKSDDNDISRQISFLTLQVEALRNDISRRRLNKKNNINNISEKDIWQHFRLSIPESTSSKIKTITYEPINNILYVYYTLKLDDNDIESLLLWCSVQDFKLELLEYN